MKWSVVVIVCVLLVLIAAGLNIGREESWRRPNPLMNPISVVEVRDGMITLEDGRVMQPAGVVPAQGISAESWDRFLRVSTAHGVEVERVLDEDRALLRVEAKFYNWCGTCRSRGGNWAGDYVQAGLGELAILCGYADLAPDQSELTEQELWRLRGCVELRPDQEPFRISESSNALRFDSVAFMLRDIDNYIEAVTD
jgi:hypothetical protein